MTLTTSVLDIKALARVQAHFQKNLLLQAFNRVWDNPVLAVDAAAKQSAQLQIDVQFGVDEYHRPCLTGEIRVSLSLICQRCMATYMQDLQIPIALVFTQEQDNKPLADGFELMPIAEGELTWVQILEDDLLLALPMVPRHSEDTCQPIALEFADPDNPLVLPEKKPNPFVVLEGFKR